MPQTLLSTQPARLLCGLGKTLHQAVSKVGETCFKPFSKDVSFRAQKMIFGFSWDHSLKLINSGQARDYTAVI